MKLRLHPCVGPGAAPSPSGSVLALLESLQNAPHLEIHKDMITWILKVNTDVTVKHKDFNLQNPPVIYE